MATILITEFMESEQVSEMSKVHNVIYEPEIYLSTNAIIEKIKNVDGLIIRNKTKIDKKILSLAKNLKVIGRLGVGLDNIDTECCKKNEINVIIADGANANSVCEYVLMGILTLFRGTRLSTEKILDGDWDRKGNTGSEIKNKTLGIIGIGTIGRAVAEKARMLGMNLIGTDIEISEDHNIWTDLNIRCASLDEVIQKSNIITIHVPLTGDTKNLFGENEFEKMQKGSFIINTSRGGIIDENALLNSLKRSHLGGAMLDVFEHEPLKNPDKFSELDNVILTPHIAGLTNQSNYRVSQMITENILDFLKKEDA